MFDLENAAEQLKKVIKTVYVIANVCTIIFGIVLIIAGFASGESGMGILMLFVAPIFVVISILLTKLMLLQSYMMCEQAEDIGELKAQFCVLTKPTLIDDEYQRRIRLIDSIVNRNKGKYSEEEINELKEFSKNASSTDFSNKIKELI